jgi:tetratricopeptide (TPR) repeat protein
MKVLMIPTVALTVTALLTGCNALTMSATHPAPVEERAAPAASSSPLRLATLRRVSEPQPQPTAETKVYAQPVSDSGASQPALLAPATPLESEPQNAPVAKVNLAPEEGQTPLSKPTRKIVPEPPATQAARTLVSQGQQLQDSGNFEQAAASYERALEIAPADPWLWHRLASVRSAQGQKGLARALARRSNALGIGDTRIEQANAGFL